jgi:hypothetical protein
VHDLFRCARSLAGPWELVSSGKTARKCKVTAERCSDLAEEWCGCGVGGGATPKGGLGVAPVLPVSVSFAVKQNLQAGDLACR